MTTPTTLISLVREMKAEEALAKRGLRYLPIDEDDPIVWAYERGHATIFADDDLILTILRGLAAEVGARKHWWVRVYESRFSVVDATFDDMLFRRDSRDSPLAEAACCLWIVVNGGG